MRALLRTALCTKDIPRRTCCISDPWTKRSEVVPGMLRDGDVVLVKGSHRIGLDRMVERIRAVRTLDHPVESCLATRT